MNKYTYFRKKIKKNKIFFYVYYHLFYFFIGNSYTILNKVVRKYYSTY